MSDLCTKTRAEGTWVAPLVKWLTLDFTSGHDLTVCGIKPVSGSVLIVRSLLEILSPSLSASPLLFSCLNQPPHFIDWWHGGHRRLNGMLKITFKLITEQDWDPSSCFSVHCQCCPVHAAHVLFSPWVPSHRFIWKHDEACPTKCKVLGILEKKFSKDLKRLEVPIVF